MNILDKQSSLDTIYERYLEPKESRPDTGVHDSSRADPWHGQGLDDADLLDKIRGSDNGPKFKPLYDHGDTSEYATGEHDGRSEGDLALCGILAWWTDYDTTRVDSLFRESELMRPKWDEMRGEQTYGQLTITKACEGKRPGDGYQAKRGARASGFGGAQDKTTAESIPWPDPLDEAAYHGVAGEVVRLIAPHTEADEAALLFQLLAAFGSAVGRKPFFLVESDEHHANINVAVVGTSAKGRKGTSQGRVKAVMTYTDPSWSKCLVSGLSSGEGLIWAVRDAIIKIKKNGEEEVVDEGVADKRLMVLEAELSSALKVMSREGNTLSATVRNAWDTGNLRTLTKNSPARATDTHIAVIGHVTKNELLRHLDATEMANGFANRFLWICVRRSKLLPFGGDLDENDIANIGVILADRLERAKSIGRLTMDAEARADWAATYTDLSEAKLGLFGSIIARSEAQVLGLALIVLLLFRTL